MDSAPLLTDLYQLAMAYGYWQTGRAEHEAVFHLHFRKSPFAGGYAIAAGLEPALDWLRSFSFSADDCAYLATLTGNDGKPLFPPAFLAHLGALRLTVDVDAIPEGTVVFPHQPLVRVRGPILQCQLLETALLCLVNFQSLIATKAARICQAAPIHQVPDRRQRRNPTQRNAASRPHTTRPRPPPSPHPPPPPPPPPESAVALIG
jgi:nicotinate phosphoribosyltransferase